MLGIGVNLEHLRRFVKKLSHIPCANYGTLATGWSIRTTSEIIRQIHQFDTPALSQNAHQLNHVRKNPCTWNKLDLRPQYSQSDQTQGETLCCVQVVGQTTIEYRIRAPARMDEPFDGGAVVFSATNGLQPTNVSNILYYKW